MLEGIALTGDKDFDLFQSAYPLAAQHAARLFGAKQLASMLGEAKAAERSWRALLRRESRQPRGQLPSVKLL